MSKTQEYDKVLTRLVIILQKLYEGEMLSVNELAEEFNVSTKTIQRDFNERLIRFPIVKSGRRWKMEDGFALNKMRTVEEELVLDMLGQIADGIGTTFGVKAKHLFSKLQNYDDNPFYSKMIIEDLTDNQYLFQILQRAIANKNIIEFIYKEKHRIVNPYKIVSFDGYWYLYAEEASESKLKTYYLKDISKPIIKNETFKDSEIAHTKLKYAINAWFEPNSEPFEVTLHANQKIAQYFKRRPLSSEQRIIKLYSDGAIDISLKATCQKEILQEIKKWMPDLTVVAPENTRLMAIEIAKNFIIFNSNSQTGLEGVH